MGSGGPTGSWGWRRCGRGAARMLALAVLLCWPGTIASQPAAPREASVQLSWSPDFTPTDIVVEEKETLSIAIEPIGEPRFASQDLVRERLTEIGALDKFVARIGDGPAFPVGREFNQVVAGGGRLSLRWDVPRDFAHFKATFVAVIRVDPAPRPDIDDAGTGNETAADRELAPKGSFPCLIGTWDASCDIANEAAPSDLQEGSGNSVAGTRLSGRDPVGNGISTPGTVPGSLGLVSFALPWLAAGAASLLLAAAGALSVRRWDRRRTARRTHSLLGLSPSLDLSEGACRGGSLPAEGPAVSLRTRLEEGRMRLAEGGEDG